MAMSGTATDSHANQRLRIGVTGHRLDRLGGHIAEQLAQAVEQVFSALESAANAGDPAQLCLITCLADGADSLAADCAVARGWAMNAVLPFAEQGARDGFYQRLTASNAAMELPGSRADSHSESVAYERAGRVLLAGCDILIAVWDGGPVRGRGGAAQIIAEAVHQGIPVVHIDPASNHAPILLWDGLEALTLGQDTVDTVAQGGLDDVPELVRHLIENPEDMPSDAAAGVAPRRSLAIAYPLLLMVMGVRRMRRSDFGRGNDMARAEDEIAGLCSGGAVQQERLKARLARPYAHADAAATRNAQLFRNGYVANFTGAALAVLLSLLGLALPPAAKPVLITLELVIIGSILIRTMRGNRAGWHRRWLDNRALAERLRCLAVSAGLGDLNLRGGHDWVASHCRATARAIGLPNGVVDDACLAGVKAALTRLIDGQITYLSAEASQMHRLEHRLHRLGTWLFAATALACIGLLLFKALGTMLPGHDALAHPATIAATIIGAALPAFGAAIYGIRMQGDFAGTAERAGELADRLRIVSRAIDQAAGFDALHRACRSATSLLTADVASWLHSTKARPLALPG